MRVHEWILTGERILIHVHPKVHRSLSLVLCAQLELLEPINGIPNESLLSLRLRFEEVGAIDFPFEFKDHDDKVHIKLKMEKLTIAQLDVYVIPFKEPNNDVTKRLRLEPSIVFDSVHTMNLGPQEGELLYNLNNFAFCPQPVGSKVSYSTTVIELIVSYRKSSTLTPEVLKR